jgi:chemotaxis protein histidine kinase CheA
MSSLSFPAPSGASLSLLPASGRLELPFPASQLLALVDALSPEELALLRSKLSLAPAAKAAPASKAAAAKKEAVPVPALPAGEDGDAPDADAYRIPEEEIKDDVCNARRFNETDASKDRRWKPAIYRELQCGNPLAEDGLCKVCAARREKFAADPTPKIGWLGRLTEEPPEWCHMLGTSWADEKKPVWGAGSVVDAVPAAAVAAAASAASTKKAEKEAAAATKKAEKEAAAAAKKAEREAAKAAAAAAKEAKAAVTAAEKAAAKAAKEATASAKKAGTAAPAPAAVASVPAKAETTAPASAVAGELMLIMGTAYMVRGKNAYSYDEMTEAVGDFVGVLTADGEGIDTDADEE